VRIFARFRAEQSGAACALRAAVRMEGEACSLTELAPPGEVKNIGSIGGRRLNQNCLLGKKWSGRKATSRGPKDEKLSKLKNFDKGRK